MATFAWQPYTNLPSPPPLNPHWFSHCEPFIRVRGVRKIWEKSPFVYRFLKNISSTYTCCALCFADFHANQLFTRSQHSCYSQHSLSTHSWLQNIIFSSESQKWLQLIEFFLRKITRNSTWCCPIRSPSSLSLSSSSLPPLCWLFFLCGYPFSRARTHVIWNIL